MVWNAQAGRFIRDLLPEASSAEVCFSPDNQWLVAGMKHEYRFWQVENWKASLVVPRNSGRPSGPSAFSPDSRMVAVETAPARVRLLDPATGDEFATLEDPHMHRPNWMSFTPDGTQLVIAADNRVIHVWDLRSLRAQLADFGLDWNLPPFEEPPPREKPVPQEITVELTPDFCCLRGVSHIRRKEFELAISLFQEALKRDADHAGACNNLAWIYATGPLEFRNPAKALPLAQKAVARIKDKKWMALRTLGVVYYRLEQWQKAIHTLEDSGKSNSAGPSACDLFFIAMSNHRLGKSGEARKWYDRAIQARKYAQPEEIEELNTIHTEANIVLSQPADR